MPSFKNLMLKWGYKLRHFFVVAKARLTRPEADIGEAGSGSEDELARLRRRLAKKNREIAELRAMRIAGRDGARPAVTLPENIVWTFGSGRTGSSWLNSMLKDPKDHVGWGEPVVGKLFADLYYSHYGNLNRENKHFILAEQYKENWLKLIRSFVLEGAFLRFPEVTEGGYVMVTEPNGSMGAPLLMEALPESRMIFLVRDPRDVVASFLDARKEGSWLRNFEKGAGKTPQNRNSLPDDQSDAFVRMLANNFVTSVNRVKEAYEAHEGHKVLVKYEDLRCHTFETMKRIYSELGIVVNEEELARTVEKTSWESLPEEMKGAGKFFRKATPGGWKEDLTPEQAKVVEEITAPILSEYYPEEFTVGEKSKGFDQ